MADSKIAEAEMTPTQLVAHKQKQENILKGFKHFIGQYGILPLAIGVVIGNAVNDLVKVLVDGLIGPFIGLLAPESAIQNLQFVVGGSTFKVGAVIYATITFLVVALVVYLVVRFILRRDELLEKK